jgi:selenocysteine lyase/cysteine desulfurase
MYKHHYSRFLKEHSSILHFAAHSHHFWPDVSRDGHMQAWDDAARYADKKWEHIFTEVIPKAQRHIAKRLGIDDAGRVVFGGSTHELVFRLISCFSGFSEQYRILTTDSEFYSFSRQISRLRDGGVSVTVVPVFPLESFKQRFSDAAKKHSPDMVYFSQVFFNTGAVVSCANEFADILSEDSYTSRTVVIDGYHGFCAIPELFPLKDENVFYTAGGYKYAQSGEGCAFMCIPENCSLRPLYTGWFADISSLEKSDKNKCVQYFGQWKRFMGSTFDPTGLYRMNAVMDWMDNEDLTPRVIHEYILSLQNYFLGKVGDAGLKIFCEKNLAAPPKRYHRAHFLSFRVNNPKETSLALQELGVFTDTRGDYLRIGFGLYHSATDIDRLVDTLTVFEQQNEVTE